MITEMIDIQSQQDNPEVPLKKVGIKGMHYPIQVLDKVHKIQKTAVLWTCLLICLSILRELT